MLELKVDPSNIDQSKVIKTLFDQSKEFEATDAHFTAHKIFKDEQATGVFSVYLGIKPAHMVLSELKQHLEDNGETTILNAIEKIEEDISFLEEEA